MAKKKEYNPKRDNLLTHIGHKIRNKRIELGLTQVNVSEVLNVSFQQVQKYEKGKDAISLFALITLADDFKVPLSYFVERYDVKNGISLLNKEDIKPELKRCNQVRNEKLYPNPNSYGEMSNHLNSVFGETLKIGQ
tara:strand:- start:469 stop:876 length:408 start_codon:yes stop_codon:yes gene_type:complete